MKTTMERRDFLTASLVGSGGIVFASLDKLGEFPFHCDVFCGSGHEQMDGTIKVTD